MVDVSVVTESWLEEEHVDPPVIVGHGKPAPSSWITDMVRSILLSLVCSLVTRSLEALLKCDAGLLALPVHVI